MRFLYYYNILLILGYILVLVAGFFGPLDEIALWFNSLIVVNVRTILNIPVLIFWVLLLRHWSKGKKKVSDFLLLFFLIGLYTIFYYKKEFKHK